jgi:CRISPR-associated endonuclease/helicase Cas3
MSAVVDAKPNVHFWAKTDPLGRPGISVLEHMLNVGHVAHNLAESIRPQCIELQLPLQTMAALAAMHDLGKISPGFQRKCEQWIAENRLEQVERNHRWSASMEGDHGKVSHCAIQRFLIEQGADRTTATYLASALGGHHGKLSRPAHQGYRPDGAVTENASGIPWDEERERHASLVWKHFGGQTENLLLTMESPELWWLAGLTSVSDWIGSDERFFPPEHEGTSCDRDAVVADALQTIGFTPIRIVENRSFESIFGFQPNDMQEKARTTVTGPGVYLIEAPMGMGKTEAALWAAYNLLSEGKAHGIYFALPTQTTSNRIHQRVNRFLQQVQLRPDASRLIHGNSWLLDTATDVNPTATDSRTMPGEDARAGRNWFSSPKRALIAPFGVGTVDQALLGVVACKHFFVRQFALAGKVVIIDEVHSYDMYTGTLIDVLVDTLESLGCTVIVLTATLIGQRRRQLLGRHIEPPETDAPYPLLSGRCDGRMIPRIAPHPPSDKTIHIEFIEQEQAAAQAIQAAREGAAVLWICDTVDAAQQQYSRIDDAVRDKFPVGLLHSRFPYWRREQLESEWMERLGKEAQTRCGSILVATQVVEQSVDLDADLMITELAPTDMLLQRTGRLWRHKRVSRPVNEARLCILEEARSLEELRECNPREIQRILGKKSKVYSPFILLRSLEVWKQAGQTIIVPTQIRSLLETTYSWREEPPSWEKLGEEWCGTDSAKAMYARRATILWQTALEDEEGVQTRVNETPTVPVVLCSGIDNREATFIDGSTEPLMDGTFSIRLARAIHKNLVRAPAYCFEQVRTSSAFQEYLYGGHAVGIVETDGRVAVKGVDPNYGFRYTVHLGLVLEQHTIMEDE